MDVKSLSEVLGHSNISVTLSIYVHSCYEIKKKFIDKIWKVFLFVESP